MAKKKAEHYVNNKELLEAMIVYRTKVEQSYLKQFDINFWCCSCF